jgi:hypothetical protein
MGREAGHPAISSAPGASTPRVSTQPFAPSRDTSGSIVFNLPLRSGRESGHSKGRILSERLCR